VQRSALCRSRRELSNEYLLAKIGFDTAENEPLKVRITDHTFDHIPSVLYVGFNNGASEGSKGRVLPEKYPRPHVGCTNANDSGTAEGQPLAPGMCLHN